MMNAYVVVFVVPLVELNWTSHGTGGLSLVYYHTAHTCIVYTRYLPVHRKKASEQVSTKLAPAPVFPSPFDFHLLRTYYYSSVSSIVACYTTITAIGGIQQQQLLQ